MGERNERKGSGDMSEINRQEDYIKRADAVEVVSDIYRISSLLSGGSDRRDDWIDKAEKAFDNVSSANVVEIKSPEHGYMWICPECGLDSHSDFNKCPRCGWIREDKKDNLEYLQTYLRLKECTKDNQTVLSGAFKKGIIEELSDKGYIDFDKKSGVITKLNH